MARTKQTAVKSTGGNASREQLARRAARMPKKSPSQNLNLTAVKLCRRVVDPYTAKEARGREVSVPMGEFVDSVHGYFVALRGTEQESEYVTVEVLDLLTNTTLTGEDESRVEAAAQDAGMELGLMNLSKLVMRCTADTERRLYMVHEQHDLTEESLIEVNLLQGTFDIGPGEEDSDKSYADLASNRACSLSSESGPLADVTARARRLLGVIRRLIGLCEADGRYGKETFLTSLRHKWGRRVGKLSPLPAELLMSPAEGVPFGNWNGYEDCGLAALLNGFLFVDSLFAESIQAAEKSWDGAFKRQQLNQFLGTVPVSRSEKKSHAVARIVPEDIRKLTKFEKERMEWILKKDEDGRFVNQDTYFVSLVCVDGTEDHCVVVTTDDEGRRVVVDGYEDFMLPLKIEALKRVVGAGAELRGLGQVLRFAYAGDSFRVAAAAVGKTLRKSGGASVASKKVEPKKEKDATNKTGTDFGTQKAKKKARTA